MLIRVKYLEANDASGRYRYADKNANDVGQLIMLIRSRKSRRRFEQV